MSESDAFKVADRRASHDEDPEAPQKKTETQPPEKSCETREPPDLVRTDALGPAGDEAGIPDEAGEEMGDGVSLISLKIPEMANFMIGMLLQKAYITMGLIPHPETGKPARDLAEAALAIDLATAVSEQMKGKWGMVGFEKELQTQLTNLRIQYAKLSPGKP
mgnify:CR=1 FL=1